MQAIDLMQIHRVRSNGCNLLLIPQHGVRNSTEVRVAKGMVGVVAGAATWRSGR